MRVARCAPDCGWRNRVRKENSSCEVAEGCQAVLMVDLRVNQHDVQVWRIRDRHDCALGADSGDSEQMSLAREVAVDDVSDFSRQVEQAGRRSERD